MVQMENSYQQLLDYLPLSYELFAIDTTFGMTNIVSTGKRGGPPLVLLHGRHSCAPLVLHQFKDLLYSHQTYAVDIPGQPNWSTEIRLSTKSDAYAQWMYEILSRLRLQHAILIGIELGALIAYKSFHFDNQYIAEAYLIAIASSGIRDRWQYYWCEQRPLYNFCRSGKASWLDLYSKHTKQPVDSLSFSYWQKLLPYYLPDLHQPPSISRQAIERIDKPIYHFNDWNAWKTRNKLA